MNNRLLKVLIVIMLVSLLGCDKPKPNALFRSPVVGLIQNNQVPILIKCMNDGDVRIQYQILDGSSSHLTDWSELTELNSYTTNIFLQEILSNSNYRYRVQFEDRVYSDWFTFKTFPEQNVAGEFNFIFSACLREKYMGYNIFEKIKQLSPTFMALLGDQMYADYDGNLNELEHYQNNETHRQTMIDSGEIVLDDTTILDAFRNKYNRVFDENYQKMASRIPLLAIWDDHDYGKDNSDETYPYKNEARKAFKENFPDYSYEENDGGIYYKFTIADVDVFVLDTRWYRSPMENQDGDSKTMLGIKQLNWFLNGLNNSIGKFKIVFSSVSLNEYGGDTSSGRDGYDNWSSYLNERNKIFNFINDNNINGVLVFSGDQHYPSAHILNFNSSVNYLTKTDTTIEYSISDMGNAIFDFSSSPLNYKIATGHHLIPENQNNPKYAHEIFRPEWAKPEKVVKSDGIVITSVYGHVEIDTESPNANVLVKFFELNPETTEMVEIYQISITN